MRKTILTAGTAASLIALIAAGAWAQTPPPALSGLPGASYEGEIGGMAVWSAPGMSDLFVVSPDGRTILRGAVFSGSGRDLGAAYTGAAPVELIPSGAGLVREGIAEELASANAIPQIPEPGSGGFSDLRGSDSCQSPILGTDFGAGPARLAPETAGWDLAGGGNPPAAPASEPLPDESGLMDGAQIARGAEAALSGFDQEERRTLLLDLVNGLRGTTTQEEFLAEVAAWRVQIDELRASKGMSRMFSPSGTVPIMPLDIAPVGAPTILAPPEITVTVLEDAPQTRSEADVVEVGQEVSLEQTLLEDARLNALWFSVGANDAPAVYAFIDPTCPYSARAVAALSDRIGAGELQLRVILAPVVSERAAGVIAALLTADKPPLAFFDHEIAIAERGRSDLEPGEFSDLPVLIQAGIRRNYEMVGSYRLPGVPFFVYETAEGARVLSGAPEGIGFPGALRDPYTGTR